MNVWRENKTHKLCNDHVMFTLWEYGFLISEWDGLYYALLGMSVNKIALWQNVRLDDCTAELAFIASNTADEIPFQSAQLINSLFFSFILSFIREGLG